MQQGMHPFGNVGAVLTHSQCWDLKSPNSVTTNQRSRETQSATSDKAGGMNE